MGPDFEDMVNAAVFRVIGLPDADFVKRMLVIVDAFEQVIRMHSPQLSDDAVASLRDHFSVAVAARCRDKIGLAAGSA